VQSAEGLTGEMYLAEHGEISGVEIAYRNDFSMDVESLSCDRYLHFAPFTLHAPEAQTCILN
jgi:hypothetical protein